MAELVIFSIMCLILGTFGLIIDAVERKFYNDENEES